MLDDLREFLDSPKLTLPIGGRSYVVGPVTAQVWLRLQELAARAAEAPEDADLASLDSMTEIELYRLSLGPAFEELVTGNVTGPELKQAGITAYYWQLGQEDFAETMWRSGGKAPAAPPPSSTPTSTGSATTTPPPGSTKPTTSPRKSKPRKTVKG